MSGPFRKPRLPPVNRALLAAMGGGLLAWFAFFCYVSEYLPGVWPSRDMSEIEQELKQILSSGATVYMPHSAGFKSATDRWNPWENPSFDVVVEVATEDDVGKTVS